jgi:lactate permease
MLPFALWAGIAFAVPSIFSVFIGQEFPSILGAVVGLILVLITTKLGIFVPKSEKEMIDEPRVATLPLTKVLFPYLFLIVLLVAGKFILGSSGILISLSIKHTFAYFNPGFAFLIAGVVSILFFKIPGKIFTSSIKISLKKSIEPFLVIAFMSGVAQIMVNSFHNSTNLPSMIEFLAMYTKNALLPLWSPFVGAFGSFLTGSATVSNLMFGNFLAAAAKDLSLNVDKILALALVGGAAGNMIALADILAAETVVGLKHQEKSVLKGVIIPCLIYLTLIGIIGLLIF